MATKAKEAAPNRFQNVGWRLRLRRKRMEQAALIVTLSFVALVGVLIWVTDGRLVTAPIEMIMSFEEPGKASRDPGMNCRNPKNAKTRYCLERKARTDAEWTAVSRHHRGKGNAFTLHGN